MGLFFPKQYKYRLCDFYQYQFLRNLFPDQSPDHEWAVYYIFHFVWRYKQGCFRIFRGKPNYFNCMIFPGLTLQKGHSPKRANFSEFGPNRAQLLPGCWCSTITTVIKHSGIRVPRFSGPKLYPLTDDDDEKGDHTLGISSGGGETRYKIWL